MPPVAFRQLDAGHVPFGMEPVQAFEFPMHFAISSRRENPIPLSRQQQNRLRRGQRPHFREIHPVHVGIIGAVALMRHQPPPHLRLDRIRRRRRHGHADPIIQGGDHPRHDPAARGAGHPDPRGVHFRTAFQIVDGPHGIPHFDAGGSIAQRKPIPTAKRMGAAMTTLDLSAQQGVDRQTGKAMFGIPQEAILKLRFGAQRMDLVAA